MTSRPSHSYDEVSAKLAELAELLNHGDLDPASQFQLVTELSSYLGARWWLFVLFTRRQWAHPAMSRHNFLGTVPSDWLQLYVGRYWYLSDVCLQYAAHNAQPTLISRLAPQTPGQETIISATTAAGMKDGVLVPCHSSSPAIAGVLNLYYDRADFTPTVRWEDHQALLRALATAVLDQQLHAIQVELRTNAKLSTIDLEMLRLGEKGLPTREIASMLHLSNRVVDRAFQRISAAFGVRGRLEAIAMARDLNLL